LLSNDINLCTKAHIHGLLSWNAKEGDEHAMMAYVRIHHALPLGDVPPLNPTARVAPLVPAVKPPVTNQVPVGKTTPAPKPRTSAKQVELERMLDKGSMDTPQNTMDLQDVFQLAATLLSPVFVKAFEDELGDLWELVCKRQPPWTFHDLIYLAVQQRLAVFSSLLPGKQMEKTVKDLLNFSKAHVLESQPLNKQKGQAFIHNLIQLFQQCLRGDARKHAIDQIKHLYA
jgi:hypothetical protein